MTGVQFATLDDVCSISTGGTPARTRQDFFGGGIPWVKIGDMVDGVVRHTEETISQAGLDNSSAKIFERGTVLISIFATIGRTAILDIDAATNQAIAGITPNEALDSNYLRYYLDSKHRVLNALARGAAQPNINQRILKSLQIPLPALEEQRRLVDLLSRAEGIVRLRREAQRKAAELVPALFLDMFGDPASNPKGWPVVTLGELLGACDYGTSKKASPDDEGVPVLRMGNVSFEGDLLLDSLKHVVLDESELERQSLESGDLLFNRTNSKELVGKTGLWDGRWPAVAASYFIRLRVDQTRVLPIYVWAVMNSKDMKKRLFATARGAIGQSNINTTELKALPCAVPPIDLQSRFAARVDAVRGIAAQQAAALATAQATFDALLHRSFAVS